MPKEIAGPVTPAQKAALKGKSIPPRIVKTPEMRGSHDWKKDNPQLKGFKGAKVMDTGSDLPYRDLKMVTRGPVGGSDGKSQSQH